jgi:ketosteroid isomerase-like protein
MLAPAAATGLGLRRIGSGMTGISTPDVEVVRRAYAALAAGDMEELEQCFARDAVWHEPGSNIYSGVRVGWPEIRDEFLALLGPLSHGTLRIELVDIAVAEQYVVAVHRATGEHNGLTLDSTSYDVVLVGRGRIQEVWATHAKQSEVDAFWT